MKPIWKTTVGGKVPSDLGGSIMFRDGSLADSRHYKDEECEWLWDKTGSSTDIVAYEVSEYCFSCNNSGKFVDSVCPNCVKRGWL